MDDPKLSRNFACRKSEGNIGEALEREEMLFKEVIEVLRRALEFEVEGERK